MVRRRIEKNKLFTLNKCLLSWINEWMSDGITSPYQNSKAGGMFLIPVLFSYIPSIIPSYPKAFRPLILTILLWKGGKWSDKKPSLWDVWYLSQDYLHVERSMGCHNLTKWIKIWDSSEDVCNHVMLAVYSRPEFLHDVEVIIFIWKNILG